MKLPRFALTAAACLSLAFSSVFAAPFGHIERLDPALDQLLAPDAHMEKIASGFTWSEGPVWYDGGLVFSDVPKNIAYRWQPGATSAKVFLQPSGQLKPAPGFREPGSNGLTLDRQGRLLLCQCGERRVARYENGAFTSVADRFEGKRFNSPNDLVVRHDGTIYFTDPPYGLEGGEKSPLREIPFCGVYRVGTDGAVTAVVRDLTFPNGIAFSPDERVLYVGVTDDNTRIMAYDVQPDGSVANPRVFFLGHSRKEPGACDGMKVDHDGNIWSSGPGGIVVLSPAGKLLGVLHTGQPTANCAWGEDGSTLFITSNHDILRIRTKTKGAGW